MKKKVYTMNEALKMLRKNSPKPQIVNKALKIELEKIVKKLIAKENREECLRILFKSSKERIGEFLYYYYSESSNVACCVVDHAKNELVKAGKMKQAKKDKFGSPYIDLDFPNKEQKMDQETYNFIVYGGKDGK